MTTKRTGWGKRLLWVGMCVFVGLIGVALFFPPVETNRIAANESAAVGHLRNVFLAQLKFRSEHGCFASDLSRPPVPPSNRDGTYDYKLEPKSWTERGCVTRYTVMASPTSVRKTAMRYFSIEETGILRLEQLRPVGPNSPVLE